MLLKALLSRLVGGTGPDPRRELRHLRRISKLTYEKYPVLADLVLHLLQRSSTLDGDSQVARGKTLDNPSSHHIETVFPALEIIERVGVCDTDKNAVKNLLLQQLGSPVWNLRDKAAKMMKSLIDGDTILKEVKGLLHSTIPIIPTVTSSQLASLRTQKTQQLPQNYLHGRLLYLKYLICSEPPHNVGKQPAEPLEPLCVSYVADATHY